MWSLAVILPEDLNLDKRSEAIRAEPQQQQQWPGVIVLEGYMDGLLINKDLLVLCHVGSGYILPPRITKIQHSLRGNQPSINHWKQWGWFSYKFTSTKAILSFYGNCKACFSPFFWHLWSKQLIEIEMNKFSKISTSIKYLQMVASSQGGRLIVWMKYTVGRSKTSAVRGRWEWFFFFFFLALFWNLRVVPLRHPHTPYISNCPVPITQLGFIFNDWSKRHNCA